MLGIYFFTIYLTRIKLQFRIFKSCELLIKYLKRLISPVATKFKNVNIFFV